MEIILGLIIFCLFCLIFVMVRYNKWKVAFDEEVLRISKMRELYKDGEMKEVGGNCYMYSKKDNSWMCIDKKFDAEITYVSSLNKDKIVSDFMRGVEYANNKDTIVRKFKRGKKNGDNV